MDGVERQYRRDRLSHRAVPGVGLHGLCGDWHGDDDQLQQHGLGSGDELQLSRASHRCSRQYEGYSAIASAATPAAVDTQAPSVPTNVAATAGSSTQMTVSWTPSSDNVGVTAYRIERCQGSGCTAFAKIGTATTTSYSNTGLAGTTSYSYRVRATDAAGNLSAYSNTATATTPSDVLVGLVAAFGFEEGTGSTTADASGNGNTGTISGATWTTQGRFGQALSFNGSSSRVSVAAAASLNLGAAMTLEGWIYPTAAQSGWRTILQRQTNADFLTASNSTGPPRPSGGGTFGTTTTFVSGTTANPVNTWTHVAVTYDGAMLRFTSMERRRPVGHRRALIQASTSPLWIGGNSPYGEDFQGILDDIRIYNRALTDAEIQGDMITAVQAGGGPDTTSPTVPTNVTATAGSSTQITVSWTASSDNIGVTGYRIEQCQGSGCTAFAEIGMATTTSYSNTGLAAATSYSYRVRATDAAGNMSGYSAIASAEAHSRGRRHAGTLGANQCGGHGRLEHADYGLVDAVERQRGGNSVSDRAVPGVGSRPLRRSARRRRPATATRAWRGRRATAIACGPPTPPAISALTRIPRPRRRRATC